MPRPTRQIGSTGAVWLTTRPTKSGGVSHVAITTIRDPDGEVRQVSRSGSTGRQAKANLRAYLTERVPPAAVRGLGGGTRVRTLAVAWIEHLEGEVADERMSATSVARYRSVLNAHVLPRMGGLLLQEVTPQVAEHHLTELGQGKGASTRNAGRTVLKAMFGMAVRRGALTHNPMQETTSVAVKRRSPLALTGDQELELMRRLRALPAAHEADLVDLVDLMLATGFRIGEMLALRWGDVDPGGDVDGVEQPCRVSVTGTLVRIPGRGLVRNPPKSAAGRRTLVLPEFGRTILDRRFMVAWGEVGPLEAMQDGPVFASRTGGFRDPSNLHKAWGAIRHEVGYGWLHLHELRKTVATNLHDRGAADRDVADQLGHARVSMTQDHYFTRGDEGGRLRAAAKLERPA